MGKFVADVAVKKMIESNQAPKKSNVVIFGLTFKENCPDIRNSKVNDIIVRLGEYGISPKVVDPWADEKEAKKEYGVSLTKMEDLRDVDCLIVAVAHEDFKRIPLEELKTILRNCEGQENVLIDVKGIYQISELTKTNINWWRL